MEGGREGGGMASTSNQGGILSGYPDYKCNSWHSQDSSKHDILRQIASCKRSLGAPGIRRRTILRIKFELLIFHIFLWLFLVFG